MLKKYLQVRKDENCIIVYGGFFEGSGTNTSYSFKIAPQSDIEFKITDNRIHRLEGEILENFLRSYDYKDLSEFSTFLQPYMDRFGGSLENNEISVTATHTFGMMQALFNFYNLAVLMTQINKYIELPEIPNGEQK